jgi:hypothetical protein
MRGVNEGDNSHVEMLISRLIDVSTCRLGKLLYMRRSTPPGLGTSPNMAANCLRAGCAEVVASWGNEGDSY